PGGSRSVVAAWEAARRAERWLEGQSPADPPAPPAIPSGPRPGEPPRLGRDAIRRVVELVAQAADAAHALHEVGILHQDIKPGNVMVGREVTRASMTDPGLAPFHYEPSPLTLSALTGP